MCKQLAVVVMHAACSCRQHFAGTAAAAIAAATTTTACYLLLDHCQWYLMYHDQYSLEVLGAQHLVVRGDSELVVKQMKGRYRVRCITVSHGGCSKASPPSRHNHRALTLCDTADMPCSHALQVPLQLSCCLHCFLSQPRNCWQVNGARLLPLYREAKQLEERCSSFEIEHIYR